MRIEPIGAISWATPVYSVWPVSYSRMRTNKIDLPPDKTFEAILRKEMEKLEKKTYRKR